MAIPLSYNVRNLFVRRTATIMTAFGVGCVVAVLVAVMALAEGFRSAIATSGSPDNAMILRVGATAEIQSAIDRGAADIVRTLPQVATDPDGTPILSTDMVIVINHPKRELGKSTNVTVRGVSGKPFAVRPMVRLVEGRTFTPGTTEVIVGKSIGRRAADCEIGGQIHQAGTAWKVVGVFEADGSAFESEIWGDAEVMLTAFKRQVYQSITARLRSPDDLGVLQETFTKDLRLKSLAAQREDEYFAKQSEQMTTMIRVLGTVVTMIMFLGAVMGAMNTMYAAVAGRTREIATLLALGFTPFGVFLSFLAESVLLCLLGGVIGCLLALPLNGLATGTTNWASFSEVAFQFRITPAILMTGIIVAAIMGCIGGALPAYRAARLSVVSALRRA